LVYIIAPRRNWGLTKRILSGQLSASYAACSESCSQHPKLGHRCNSLCKYACPAGQLNNIVRTCNCLHVHCCQPLFSGRPEDGPDCQTGTNSRLVLPYFCKLSVHYQMEPSLFCPNLDLFTIFELSPRPSAWTGPPNKFHFLRAKLYFRQRFGYWFVLFDVFHLPSITVYPWRLESSRRFYSLPCLKIKLDGTTFVIRCDKLICRCWAVRIFELETFETRMRYCFTYLPCCQKFRILEASLILWKAPLRYESR